MRGSCAVADADLAGADEPCSERSELEMCRDVRACRRLTDRRRDFTCRDIARSIRTTRRARQLWKFPRPTERLFASTRLMLLG